MANSVWGTTDNKSLPSLGEWIEIFSVSFLPWSSSLSLHWESGLKSACRIVCQVVEKVTTCVRSNQSVAALGYDSSLDQYQNGDIVLLWRVLGKGFEIRHLIYTTNSVEGYHRQLRKVTKSKSIFPTPKRLVNCFSWQTAISSKSGPCPFKTGRRSSTN
jgi:hypothetical protein